MPPDLLGPDYSRRGFISTGLTGLALISARPVRSQTVSNDLARTEADLFGSGPIRSGRVKLHLPPISENGYSVPVRITVDSPMTHHDHVRRLVILSPRNPVALIGQFYLSPANGKAEISTRIRLGGTQRVKAVAELSDGSLWSDEMETVVTLAACIVL